MNSKFRYDWFSHTCSLTAELGLCDENLVAVTGNYTYGNSFSISEPPFLQTSKALKVINFNPLSTKLYMSNLKTHFVPRSKHSLPRL